MTFKLIDMDNWHRKEYFNHYYHTLPCSYSISVKLDITHLKETNKKLYPTLLYYLTQVINQHEEFRIAFDKDKQLGYFDHLNPCFTIFHKDTETFSTIWSECISDYDTFIQAYQHDLQVYGENKQLEGKPNTPLNVFNVSMIPWVSFEGFNLNCPNNTDYFIPIFTIGKYYQESDRWLLPLAIQVHHAVSDGFHTSRLINELQQLINTQY